jgi:hypothetical protein
LNSEIVEFFSRFELFLPAGGVASRDRPKSRMVAQDFCISEKPADKVGEPGLRFCQRSLIPVQAGEDALLGAFFQQLFFL